MNNQKTVYKVLHQFDGKLFSFNSWFLRDRLAFLPKGDWITRMVIKMGFIREYGASKWHFFHKKDRRGFVFDSRSGAERYIERMGEKQNSPILFAPLKELVVWQCVGKIVQETPKVYLAGLLPMISIEREASLMGVVKMNHLPPKGTLAVTSLKLVRQIKVREGIYE